MSGIESLRDVALRPWPVKKSEKLNQEELLAKIQQLTTERGHLRNITEASLQADIDAGKDVPEDTKGKDAKSKAGEKVPTQAERLEEIFAMQREIAGHLDWARFAANNALDLISLALSTDPNKRSATSFSPMFRELGLNQGIPFGSFAMSKENHAHHMRKPEEVQTAQDLERRQDLVAKGARMHALDSAVDELLKAAKDMDKETKREAKFMSEVVAISEKGWPIQRQRGDGSHAPFAVRYGLPEASDQFKARGFASLRSNEDGSIALDPKLASQPRTLRIRVCEGEKITGISQLPATGDVKDLPIEKTIQMARDSLFEEELFHEMTIETRQLLPYGVSLKNSVVQVDMPTSDDSAPVRKLLIDCITRSQKLVDDQNHTKNWLAHSVAEMLRILLTHEHSMRLHRRSQIPPPMTAKPREKLVSPLLRPLLAILHHYNGTTALHTYLKRTTHTLISSHIPATLSAIAETTWANLIEMLKTSSKRGLSPTDQVLETFIKPLNGEATLVLPSPTGVQQGEIIAVETRTVIGQPTFGTEHKLTLPAPLVAALGLSTTLKFSDAKEVTSYLDWVLSLHLAHRVLKCEFGARAEVKSDDPKISITSPKGKETRKGIATSWTVTTELANGRLTASATTAEMRKQGSGAGADERRSLWDGSKNAKGLTEVVQEWIG